MSLNPYTRGLEGIIVDQGGLACSDQRSQTMNRIDEAYSYICSMTSYELWRKVWFETTHPQAHRNLRVGVWETVRSDPVFSEDTTCRMNDEGEVQHVGTRPMRMRVRAWEPLAVPGPMRMRVRGRVSGWRGREPA